MQYIKITVQNISEAQSEMLIAQLGELSYDGFEEANNLLYAYINEELYNEEELKEILSIYNVEFTKETIEQQNWNALWESNFQPVIVDDFVAVRASFHERITNTEHEILITPKMSFGTGHHATTFMMMQLMRDVDFKTKKVFDFGSGTGILAILAEKLGASKVLAVDNDDWCIENATENAINNHCKNVIIDKADDAKVAEVYDVILANINKNIILENMQALAAGVYQNGIILFSGLLVEDETDIHAAAQKHGLHFVKKLTRNNWIALQYNKF